MNEMINSGMQCHYIDSPGMPSLTCADVGSRSSPDSCMRRDLGWADAGQRKCNLRLTLVKYCSFVLHH